MTYEEKIISLAGTATSFDPNLIVALQTSEDKIAEAQAVLTGGGHPTLATKLGTFDHAQAKVLATYISEIEPEVLDRMMQYSSLSELRRVFIPTPDASVKDTSVSVAFGSIFKARLFISSLANLPSIMAEGPTVSYADGPYGEVGDDVENCCDTAPPEEDPEAEPVETVEIKLDARIDEILAVATGAQAVIDAEVAYFSDIDAEIDRYTKAIMLYQGFNSVPSNFLVSAFASEEVLGILKIPDDS